MASGNQGMSRVPDSSDSPNPGESPRSDTSPVSQEGDEALANVDDGSGITDRSPSKWGAHQASSTFSATNSHSQSPEESFLTASFNRAVAFQKQITDLLFD
ncbi:hypothetical protein MTO96_026309 [Rhipicephalus appendiculatus]